MCVFFIKLNLSFFFFLIRLKDAKPFVPDGTHVKEIRNPDGTVALLLDACSLEDAGRFSLVAKNPLGEETSSGTLDVSGKYTQIYSIRNDLLFYYLFSLDCNVYLQSWKK